MLSASVITCSSLSYRCAWISQNTSHGLSSTSILCVFQLNDPVLNEVVSIRTSAMTSA